MSSPSPARRLKKAAQGRKFTRCSSSLRAVLESASEAVVVIDAEDRIVFCNGEAARLWAAGTEELTGRGADLLFGPRFAFLSLDAPEGQSFVTEAEAIRADGVAFTVRLTLRRVKIQGKAHRALWMSPAWSCREQRETRSTERIQVALERFAAGLAHDWNNLLTVVLGNLHLALEDAAGTGRPRGSVLDSAYQATLRGRELARGLLQFATGEAPNLEPHPVTSLAWESGLQGLSGSRAKLEADFGRGLWMALLDKAQTGQAIQQVVAFAANLATQAEPIRLTGRNLVVESPDDTLGGRLLPGDFVVISLSAEHVRLREDDLQQLFQPYLDVLGGNQGLRLAKARAFLARQDGWLDAERTASGGTVFHFYLPAVRSDGANMTSIAGTSDPREGLSVLVMDDEPLVCKVLQRTLESMGHRVTVVCEGEEAVQAYADAMTRGDRFDLAILDLKAGAGLGGVETCERIREYDPLATCVLSSGSVLDECMMDYHGHGFAGVLEKPFEAAALAHLIESVPGRRDRSYWAAMDGDEELISLAHENILAVDFNDPERRWE